MLDHPPIPMYNRQEFPFPSAVYEGITYVFMPYDQRQVPHTILTQRVIAAQRRPLNEKMRDLMLHTDLAPYLSKADVSKTYETLNALQSGALGIPDADLLFVDQVVEPIMIRNVPEYRALAEQDEELAYERRMRDMADLLCAVEQGGDRYTFPAGDHDARFAYVRDHMDVLDINTLYLQTRNLAKMSADAEKNSALPSTSV
jgi:hypothetical protein